MRTGKSETPVVVSIIFDEQGLAIGDRHGKVDWFAYSSLTIRDGWGDRIILGQRFRPRFRLDLAGSAAREYRARMPPAESRWSRLRRWVVRSPKLAVLAILVPAYLLEHIPGSWIAPITPAILAARLDGGIEEYISATQCRSKGGEVVLDVLVKRLTPSSVPAPTAFAVEQSSFFVSARLGGQLLVDRAALVEIEAPVLAALIGHELAHIEHGDLIRAAGRGEGTRFVEHIFLGSYADRLAAMEFSSEEEARADRAAIDILREKQISIGPAAAFFARNEKARREGSYFAQNYSDLHPGLPYRANAWAAAARRQRPPLPLLSEQESDHLFNICWKRIEGTRWKWSP